MNETLPGLVEQYASALRTYLARPQEAGLMRAYELGRQALALSVGVAELVVVHGQALAAVLAETGSSADPERLTRQAAEFLGETVAPFEMALRGYQESNALLQRLNNTLEQRVKERTAALQESEERYRDLFENACDLIHAASPDGCLLFVNRAWRANLGFTADEVSKLVLADIIHAEHRSSFVEVCRRALAGESQEQVECVFVAKDGRPIFVEGSVNGHYVEGRAVATRGIFHDVTQRRQMEQELREAGRRKDEFLAILAHELRNPLAPVRNALEIMRVSGHDAATIAQARAVMERQVHNLVRLIDDLMDVSRISRGKIELRKERLNLATIVQSAVEISGAQVHAARHELTVTLPSEPLWVHADHARLAQVVANLLNNAAKYTEPGGRIGLTAERHGDQAAIHVRDTGIGVPAEMLPHLFDMFVQVTSSLERSQGGLGIGLTLVRRLVEMHGGTVEAHSAGAGQGSEFVVRLPLAPEPVNRSEAAPPVPTQPPPGGSSGLRILVVDDNRDSAESLGMLLKLLGHEVRMAHNGPAALESARTFQPAIMLLDIEMPGMNGYEVARRAREEPSGKDMLLVAMTGYAGEQDRRHCDEAGFDRHMVKPVDLSQLQHMLASLVGRRR
jgi:PAS domain S-box-containing protein